MVGSRPTFATSALLPNATAPLPLSSTFSTGSSTATINFDEDLVDKVLGGAAGPWVIRISNLAKTFIGKTIAGTTATIVCNSGGVPDPGPNLINYNPPPNNIESLVGTLPAAAFSLTPTIIP